MGRLRQERRAASELWREFRETKPGRSIRIPIQWPKALMVMGIVDRIDYTTTHKGKLVPYKHRFAPGSKPLLCAGKKPGQLYLIGTRFKVDAHGIIDLDGAGRRRIRRR